MLLTPTFGPYELDELLGRGRAGEVHRAWDTVRHRTVALRILPPELTDDEPFRARFIRDCALVAQVDEPHVVAVHDFGEIDGRLFVDTQLVDGRALSAVLAAEGPLPPGLAVDVVGQVAAALDAVHAAGLVHGGVRPADVLLSGHSDRPECHLTGFGTAGADGTADHRADVHSLARLLQEVLTGRPPSPGDRSVPRALDAVLARGTAEDPAERYASAGELARAARAALGPASDTVPVRAVLPPSTAAASSGAAARGAVTGGAVVRGARHRAAPPAPRSGRRRGLAAALVAGAVALTAAGGVAAVRLASDDSAVTTTPVVLEPADDPGDDAFVPAQPRTAEGTGGTDRAGQGTDDATPGTGDAGQGTGEPGSGTDSPGSGAGTRATAAGSPVTGDRPGLYGGSGAEVCDPAGMAAFLAENPDRGAAFAGVEGIPGDGIDDRLAALTPVVLRFDTAVTNHGFADGRAVPFQSVLQAGTAVLVDDSGVPQVRCICGNPLEPPAVRPSPEYEGDPWPGSTPETVVVVERSPRPVPALVLVDDATGGVLARPVGTTGDADQDVDAALAEQARGFGGDRARSPSEAATTTTVPPSGGTVAPAPGSGTGSPPGADLPAPADTGQPDAPAPEDGTGADAPADGVPAEEVPAEQVPGGEPPAEGAPTEQAPEEQAPGEQSRPEEGPTEGPVEEPTEETPAVETPAVETPTGEPAAP